ncbi:MAG: peptidoglycan DD-metalloendopeptidase family protein [Pseudomonadota bacterium]
MFTFARCLAGPLALLALGAAPETFTRDELETLEAERQDAATKLAAIQQAETAVGLDVSQLNEELIAAAMESRRREEQAATAERRLIDLDLRRAAANRALFEDEAALEDLLAALVSSARTSPPALAVSPDQANRSVRAAIIMGDSAPELALRAAELGEEIDTLNTLERKIRREQARLDAAEATLALKQAEIEKLAAAKRAQFEDFTADADRLRQRARALAEQAAGLRELLAALEADAPETPGRKPRLRPRYASLGGATGGTVTDAVNRPATAPAIQDLQPLGPSQLGALLRPVTGLVSESFGDRRSTGSRAEGITIVTRQRAQVIAPVDGVIEFADVFRSYGHMLILRTSDDYRVIMTGLSETYGTRGQSVAAGEPVGQMSSRSNPPPELYLELRKNDRSENPAKWLAR